MATADELSVFDHVVGLTLKGLKAFNDPFGYVTNCFTKSRPHFLVEEFVHDDLRRQEKLWRFLLLARFSNFILKPKNKMVFI